MSRGRRGKRAGRDSRECGKVRFRDQEEAKRALGFINRDSANRRERTPHRWYECDRCHGYHLTSHEG